MPAVAVAAFPKEPLVHPLPSVAEAADSAVQQAEHVAKCTMQSAQSVAKKPKFLSSQAVPVQSTVVIATASSPVEAVVAPVAVAAVSPAVAAVAADAASTSPHPNKKKERLCLSFFMP